jgi:serine/threonine protein kinase
MHYSGYEVLEVVQKSEAEIYRCLENNRTIILKATPETVSGEQLKKEFNIGRIVCERTESVVVYERLFENYDAEKLSVFIVMEDGGQDLLSLLPSTGFTVKKVLKIAIQCSQALAAIHKHGIIHCKIKQTN